MRSKIKLNLGPHINIMKYQNFLPEKNKEGNWKDARDLKNLTKRALDEMVFIKMCGCKMGTGAEEFLGTFSAKTAHLYCEKCLSMVDEVSNRDYDAWRQSFLYGKFDEIVSTVVDDDDEEDGTFSTDDGVYVDMDIDDEDKDT